jgi:hypothetical protein
MRQQDSAATQLIVKLRQKKGQGERDRRKKHFVGFIHEMEIHLAATSTPTVDIRNHNSVRKWNGGDGSASHSTIMRKWKRPFVDGCECKSLIYIATEFLNQCPQVRWGFVLKDNDTYLSGLNELPSAF